METSLGSISIGAATFFLRTQFRLTIYLRLRVAITLGCWLRLCQAVGNMHVGKMARYNFIKANVESTNTSLT